MISMKTRHEMCTAKEGESDLIQYPFALALDGRGRASLASNLVDNLEHKGSLFWLMQGVSPPEPGNMTLDLVGWSHKVTLFPPLPKKPKHEVQWEATDLPTVPVMVNKKAIKAHTRLVVHQEQQKSKDKVDV